MEIQLNEFTKIEVESRITSIQLKNEKKNELQMLYLRNDKIIGAEVAVLKKFIIWKFYIVLFLAVLAGAGHYFYDTQVLEYLANPPLIVGIFSAVLVIGLFFCFGKRKFLKVLVEAEGSNGFRENNRYSFKVGPDVEEKKLMDLLYLLAI